MQVELFIIEQCECLYFSNHLYSRHGTCSDCCGNHLKGEGWEDGSVGRRAFALKKWRSGADTQGPAYWRRHQSLSSFWDHSDIFPGDFGPCRWRHFCVQSCSVWHSGPCWSLFCDSCWAVGRRVFCLLVVLTGLGISQSRDLVHLPVCTYDLSAGLFPLYLEVRSCLQG